MIADLVLLVGFECCYATVLRVGNIVQSTALAYYINIHTICWILRFSYSGIGGELSKEVASLFVAP